MKSILVIEDDACYRSSIELILKMEGFSVRCAQNGSTGIGMIREQRPDLILCDIMMPGFDGHSVLEYLQNDGEFADIPFIFVTALSDRSDVRRAMSSGADDYLTKPFSAEELLDAVTGRLSRIKKLRTMNNRQALPQEQLHLLKNITNREREILLLVGNGDTSNKIAHKLGITLNTVEVHRSNLMKKLKAENAATLTRWAVALEQSLQR